MNINSIGKNIKDYRKANRLHQKDLAQKTGLSVTYIGMVERGEKMPSLKTFISILNALNVSADVVLGDVLKNGYVEKNSLLNENILKLNREDLQIVYNIVEIMAASKDKE